MFAFYTPGPMELTILLVVSLLLFGRKMPQMAANFGKSFFSFKKGLAEGEKELNEVKQAITKIGTETAAAVTKEPEPEP